MGKVRWNPLTRWFVCCQPLCASSSSNVLLANVASKTLKSVICWYLLKSSLTLAFIWLSDKPRYCSLADRAACRNQDLYKAIIRRLASSEEEDRRGFRPFGSSFTTTDAERDAISTSRHGYTENKTGDWKTKKSSYHCAARKKKTATNQLDRVGHIAISIELSALYTSAVADLLDPRPYVRTMHHVRSRRGGANARAISRGLKIDDCTRS